MVKVPQVVSLLSSIFLLNLDLSNAALAVEHSLAPDEIKAQQNSERKGSPGLFKQDPDTRKGIHTMEGELLRLEGDLYQVVKRSDGKFTIDDTTQVTRKRLPQEGGLRQK